MIINERQGEVFAWVIIYHRVNPLSIMQRYHLVSGKLSARADWMLGIFSARGGAYSIGERSPDCADLVLSYQGREYHSRLTWVDAQKEPFSKTKNYSTPHKRMQMLWARAISDGVRTIAPDLVTGVYSPEEIADFSGVELPAGHFVEAAGDEVGSHLVETPQAEPEAAPEPVYSESLDEIVNETEVLEIRDLIASVAQSVPGLAQSIRDRLAASGCKLAECDVIYQMRFVCLVDLLRLCVAFKQRLLLGPSRATVVALTISHRAARVIDVTVAALGSECRTTGAWPWFKRPWLRDNARFAFRPSDEDLFFVRFHHGVDCDIVFRLAGMSFLLPLAHASDSYAHRFISALESNRLAAS